MAALPRIVSPFDATTIVSRLDTASRRGRMAGFEKGSGGTLFGVETFGAFYDGMLSARGESDGAGTALRLSHRLKPKMPLIFTVIMIATVWPGVWLTDSFLANFEFARNWIPTWWWYLPLSIVSAVWALWEAQRRNEKVIAVSIAEMAQKIATEIDGRIEN